MISQRNTNLPISAPKTSQRTVDGTSMFTFITRVARNPEAVSMIIMAMSGIFGPPSEPHIWAGATDLRMGQTE